MLQFMAHKSKLNIKFRVFTPVFSDRLHRNVRNYLANKQYRVSEERNYHIHISNTVKNYSFFKRCKYTCDLDTPAFMNTSYR